MIRVTNIMRCDICYRAHIEDYTVIMGNEMPKPSMPEGWRVLFNSIICDRHKVEVVLDGKRWIDA
jgi:hypothetical protein